MPETPIRSARVPLYTHGAAHEALEAMAYAQRSGGALSQGEETREAVRSILADVHDRGDEALYELAQRFGDALQSGAPIRLPDEDWHAACDRVPADVKTKLDEACANISRYCETMMNTLPVNAPTLFEHQGYRAGFRLKPVEKVACYVPAGRYPLVSSAMMTAFTARAAGVHERIVLCANPKDEILYLAKQAGASGVYQIGGAQALAAVAYGTTQVPRMDMVVGPGNRFVNEAKKQLSAVMGIDLLAGPSEVYLVAAGDALRADWLALDLIAQAEHDPDARAYLLTPSIALAEAVQAKVAELLPGLNTPDFVVESALPASGIFVLESLEACVQASNTLAPEHLHLHGDAVLARQEAFTHYGTLFVGAHATVAHGDYCAGPNHTLPTQGTARFASALSPLTFLRVQNILEIPEANVYLNDLTAPLADLENLAAHAASVRHRNT